MAAAKASAATLQEIRDSIPQWIVPSDRLRAGLSLVDATTMCATTPARELGLVGHGLLAVDAAADVVVLDAHLGVVQTYVGGQLAYSRAA